MHRLIFCCADIFLSRSRSELYAAPLDIWFHYGCVMGQHAFSPLPLLVTGRRCAMSHMRTWKQCARMNERWDVHMHTCAGIYQKPHEATTTVNSHTCKYTDPWRMTSNRAEDTSQWSLKCSNKNKKTNHLIQSICRSVILISPPDIFLLRV